MDDKGSVGKISVSSDSVSTLNSEDFVLVSRLGDETPSSTNNGSDDEKTGLKIVGNGSEQQLQRELEDVLMDPSVADTGFGPETGMDSLGGGDHGLLPTTASPVPPGSDPLSAPPAKVEMVLPVQTAQESELNERSYRADESSSDGSPSSPIPDEDSVVFSQLTYLGCASVNAPRSEVEALRMMSILRGQCQLPWTSRCLCQACLRALSGCWTPTAVQRSPTTLSIRFCSVCEATMAHQKATALPSRKATTMLRSSGSMCSAAKSKRR